MMFGIQTIGLKIKVKRALLIGTSARLRAPPACAGREESTEDGFKTSGSFLGIFKILC